MWLELTDADDLPFLVNTDHIVQVLPFGEDRTLQVQTENPRGGDPSEATWHAALDVKCLVRLAQAHLPSLLVKESLGGISRAVRSHGASAPPTPEG